MKKIISMLVSLLIVCQGMNICAAFPDIDEATLSWAGEAVNELSDAGIINGYEDGTFRPGNDVTRAEFAKMISCAFECYGTEREFKDIEGHWAEEYILKSENLIYAPSYYYYPDRNATRAEVAYALARALKLTLTYDLSEVESGNAKELAKILAEVAGWDTAETGSLSKFTDADSVYHEMVPWVSAAVDAGLINGYEDSTIRGNDSVTRAEAATMILRAMNYENADQPEDEGNQNPESETVLPEDNNENSDAEITLPENENTGSKENGTVGKLDVDGPSDEKYDELLEKGHIYTLYPQRYVLLVSSVTKIYDENDDDAYKIRYFVADTGDEYESVIDGDTTVLGIRSDMSEIKKGDIMVHDTGFWGEIGCLYVLSSCKDYDAESQGPVACPDSWSVYPGEYEFEILAGTLENVEVNSKSYEITVKTQSGVKSVTVPKKLSADIYDSSRKNNIWDNDDILALKDTENTFIFIRFTDGKATELVAGLN